MGKDKELRPITPSTIDHQPHDSLYRILVPQSEETSK